MTEETKPKAAVKKTAGAQPEPAKKPKKPDVEDKPFIEFIEENFNPALKSALADKGITDLELLFQKASIPIEGIEDNQEYWQVIGNWQGGQRQFNIYFLDEDIKGKKAFSCTSNGEKTSTIESFMIDERKVTLDLMLLYTLQRLNGQKWLAKN
jgi:hypothetical protein